ncbi:MAG: hypothetical protein R2822_23975 [Spirosomataceae bacterium]
MVDFGSSMLGIFSVWLIISRRPLSDLLLWAIIILLSGGMRLPVFSITPLNLDESQVLA